VNIHYNQSQLHLLSQKLQQKQNRKEKKVREKKATENDE